jgi:hypothetical protein
MDFLGYLKNAFHIKGISCMMKKKFVISSLFTKEGISWDRKCTSFLGIHSPSKKCTTTMSRQISSKKGRTRIYELGLFIMPAEFR